MGQAIQHTQPAPASSLRPLDLRERLRAKVVYQIVSAARLDVEILGDLASPLGVWRAQARLEEAARELSKAVFGMPEYLARLEGISYAYVPREELKATAHRPCLGVAFPKEQRYLVSDDL